jgi:Predicted methyltransferase regulatory domain/Methyltransferase domain
MPAERSDSAYLTEVPYVRQFCAELNPAMLRATAALAGCPPPAGDDFDYAELGSGLGDTLATFAAAYPRARFVGVDIRPDHVRAARALASLGAVENVRFVERDLEDLRTGELPSLDYLCAHGLLTWISPAKRRALWAYAAAQLKVGGLLYLGYNALPGWAAVEPLRRLMLDAAAAFRGNGEQRIRHALATAKLLCDADAEYFVANPSAKEILALMVKMGIPYAAHEFFNAHWEPMYFGDVVEEAADHGLRFVGQLPLHLNFRDLATAPPLQEACHSVSDRRAWERMRAFATNEFFRRDVYVKGGVLRAEDTTRAYLDATPFGTLVSADEVTRDLPLPGGSLRFTGPLFEALIPALARRSSTLADLAGEPSLAAFGADRVRQAVLQLAMGKHVIPMALSSEGVGVVASRYRVPSPFNRVVLTQALSRKSAVTLASPVAGTGVAISMLDAIALQGVTEPPPGERAAWIRALVDSNPLRLVDHGRPIDDKEDLAQRLASQVDEFCATRLPKLMDLGIVETAGA